LARNCRPNDGDQTETPDGVGEQFGTEQECEFRSGELRPAFRHAPEANGLKPKPRDAGRHTRARAASGWRDEEVQMTNDRDLPDGPWPA
jgi:hypothetical protein